MNNLLKNKPLLIVAGVILVVVVFGGLVFFRNTSSQTTGDPNILPTEIPIPTILPQDLGLSLVEGEPGKTVILAVENIDGISAIEYELSWIAKGDLPRGAVGSLDLKKTPATKEIKLGTCSDVCHYDEDVVNISAVLKVTKDDGSVYSSTVSIE